MKTVFLTFTTTIIAISFAATLFLNTILGAFGLVTTSVETLSNLQSSQKVVEQMKTRHKANKLKVSKKFAKRSTRRVASGTLAAATIGTIAVAVTMASFEVYDYCEDKKGLQEDANILFETTDEFDFEQCLKEGKNDSKQILADVKDIASDNVLAAMNSTAEYSSEKWLLLKESTDQTFRVTNDATNELWSSTKEWLNIR